MYIISGTFFMFVMQLLSTFKRRLFCNENVEILMIYKLEIVETVLIYLEVFPLNKSISIRFLAFLKLRESLK